MKLVLLICMAIFTASNCFGQAKTLGNDDFGSTKSDSAASNKSSKFRQVEKDFAGWRYVDEPVQTAEGTIEIRYNLTSNGWVYGIETIAKDDSSERKGIWVADRKKLTELSTLLNKLIEKPDVNKGSTVDLCGSSFSIEKIRESEFLITVKSGNDCEMVFTAAGTLNQFTIKTLQAALDKTLEDSKH